MSADGGERERSAPPDLLTRRRLDPLRATRSTFTLSPLRTPAGRGGLPTWSREGRWWATGLQTRLVATECRSGSSWLFLRLKAAAPSGRRAARARVETSASAQRCCVRRGAFLLCRALAGPSLRFPFLLCAARPCPALPFPALRCPPLRCAALP